MERIREDLIAVCGMNCAVCKAHLRPKNACPGCRYIETEGPKTIVFCRMRICEKRAGEYCYECNTYPCDNLMHLDKRYRTKYGMSEIENLECIRDKGIDQLIQLEREKWQSENGIFCVHDKKVYFE